MAQPLLFIRMDRLGDLVLTLPCDQTFAQDQVHWFVAQNTGFILKHAKPVRSGDEFEKQFSWFGAWRMWRTMRALNPLAVVIFHAPWWVSLLAFMARIPVRVGRRSQWHSFLFFNYGLRQRRHFSERHELEYNMELCQHLAQALRRPTLSSPGFLELTASDPRGCQKWRLQPKNYFVVHPGMGGSALNWPTNSYVELIRLLLQYKPVVITGTPADDVYVAPVQAALKDRNDITWLNNRLNAEELLDLYTQAALVVAPSTGVVHLAAALGVPTLGLYSPVVAHAAKRWRPLGRQVRVLEAPLQSPAEDSMKALSVETVMQAALEIQK